MCGSFVDSRWTLEAVGETEGTPDAVRGRRFPARVPGCVHSELVRAGVIGDPDRGFNERECQWIGRTDWLYRCSLAASPELLAHDRVDLVFDGLRILLPMLEVFPWCSRSRKCLMEWHRT